MTTLPQWLPVTGIPLVCACMHMQWPYAAVSHHCASRTVDSNEHHNHSLPSLRLMPHAPLHLPCLSLRSARGLRLQQDADALHHHALVSCERATQACPIMSAVAAIAECKQPHPHILLGSCTQCEPHAIRHATGGVRLAGLRRLLLATCRPDMQQRCSRNTLLGKGGQDSQIDPCNTAHAVTQQQRTSKDKKCMQHMCTKQAQTAHAAHVGQTGANS